jgi:hypothetical protein
MCCGRVEDIDIVVLGLFRIFVKHFENRKSTREHLEGIAVGSEDGLL